MKVFAISAQPNFCENCRPTQLNFLLDLKGIYLLLGNTQLSDSDCPYGLSKRSCL